VTDAAAKRVVERLGRSKNVRHQIEGRLDECYRFALPGRLRFNQMEGTSTGPDDDIYDETAVVALEDYASIIHSRLTPDFFEWASLKADSSIQPRDRAAVNRDLEEICTYAFEHIHGSNFSQEAQESYLDLGCSTGSMLVEWRNGGLLHSSLPLTQVYFEPGIDDAIGGMFRVRENIRAELIPPMYGTAANIPTELQAIIDKEGDKPLTVIDAIWRTYGPEGGGERHVVVRSPGGTLGDVTILSETFRGEGSLPFLAFRFSKAAGEVYGRGPIMKIISGIKTTNLVIELMLQNAAMSLVGMYQYEDDSTINPATVKIEPGTLIPHAPGSQGIRRIDTAGAEFQVAGIILDDQRRNIRNGTYTDALGDPNRSPMKAAEVHARTGEMAQRISANIGRLTSEMIRPYMRRVLRLLVEKRRIELPIPMENIIITPEGPLAQAVRYQRFQSFAQLHEAIAMVYGPQIAPAYYDDAKLIDFLRRSLSSPLEPMADEAKLRENLERAAQMAAAATAMQGGAA
jgi:hypothetical protein